MCISLIPAGRPGRPARPRRGIIRIIQAPRALSARSLGLVLAAALAAAGLPAVAAGPAWAAAGPSTGSAPAPVSNAFALGGGLGGQVDPRTGAFQASLPLVNVGGRAGTGLSLALSYDQSLAAQGAAGDRFGLGAGWSLGIPWVNTAGGVRVYPASGGSYAYDAGSPTGLHDYPLRDLTFAKQTGTIPARPGVAARSYAYTLTSLDGTVDRFDANGNLIEQADRFGNLIDLTWKQAGSWWQPVSVIDNYGQVTTFDYSTPGQVKVISPPTAEKITATVTLGIRAGLLDQVTDALGQQTTFGYGPVPGLTAQLLNSVTSPGRAHTGITYTTLGYEPNVVTVNDVTVTDAASHQVLPTVHFNINPPRNTGSHNYTGYPQYNDKAASCGCDALFDSGDFGYQYTTELSNGTSVVDSTYNSLHLLVTRKVYLHPSGGAQTLSQTQTYTYPPVASVANLPANYAQPTSVTIVYGDPAFGATRTTVTKSAYNDQGELTSATDAAGAVTTYTYGSYGLPLSQTETGADGTTSITADTLTADSKSVHTVTTATGATAKAATARTVATYGYNDFGQVTSESVTWAPGAKPSGPSGGPDQVDDTQQISTDTAAHTQTDVFTTAAGTPQAASTTTVTDLVTGQVLSQTDPGNLTTTYTYDALGRHLTQTAPGGLTTRTVYDSPTQTTVTAPSGLVTQTTTDVTGRTIKVTDNVSGQKLVTDPAARTLETDTYSPDGTQLATTTPAGTTTTTMDPLGRPVSIVRPGGLTQTDTYNDVANTQTVKVLGAGATSPTSVTTDAFNHLNQPTSSAVSYPDGTPQAAVAQTYDGLGRVASYTAGNLTATPDYAGAGGLQTGTTVTPEDTSSFPGAPLITATGNTMTGALTAKTLTSQPAGGQSQAEAAASDTGTTFTYNAAGQVATATDPAGHTTSYAYTPAGQIATITAPSGTVTTFAYDPVTGRLDTKTIKAPGGVTQATGYTYYPDTGLVKSVYDPAHPADAISYDYDADGHVTAVHYPDGTSTAASYDDNGELATTTDITGAVTTYTYNADRSCGPTATDLCGAVQARDGTTLASVGYHYDSLDRIDRETRGNHVITTLTYTDASQPKTLTVTAADGTTVRADSYTYDSHGNPATHTITTALPAPAAPGQARRPAAGTPTTTTAYGYDAYNRLISSKVYPGNAATGTPATATSYTIDPAGDVTGQATTTAAGTTTTVDTIGGGQLTARTTGGKTASQAFNTDGAVTKDLAGNTYTYTPAGQQATVTTATGTTTSYTYWPDGTRRTATTTAGGVAHTITYHYATSGQIADDTYTGGGPAVTASYLLAVNREARTLATSAGAGYTTQASGPGTGYYLTDAHGSDIAMIDDNGQVTASYAYDDYGQPIGASPALLPVPAADPAGNAAVNPFTYNHAYTNPGTGTQYLPARTYDSSQGRFLSLDSADQVNRYQAFAANPITNTDPTGQVSLAEIATDAFSAVLFIVLGVLSAGSAVPVLAAAAASEAVTAVEVVTAVANVASAAANIGAAATSAALLANDVQEGLDDGHGFFTDEQKAELQTATFALGTIGGFTGAIGATPDVAGNAAEALNPVKETAGEVAPAVPEVAGAERPVQPADLWNGGGPPPADTPLPPNPWNGGGPPPADIPPPPGQVNLPGEPAVNPDIHAVNPNLNVDPQVGQFNQEVQAAGQDAQLNPQGPPDNVLERVPDNPLNTDPGLVVKTTAPTVPADLSSTGAMTNSLTQDANLGVQRELDGNNVEEVPETLPNPTGANTSTPALLPDNGSDLSSPLGAGYGF